MVSVIVPTFNRKEKLQLCIESILNQTFEGFELIVVDDGSTDGTKEMLSQVEDERLFYYQKENQKLPSIARNFGIKRSKGRYIAFLDSDDLWEPQKLELQVQFLEENKDYSFCYTQGHSDQFSKKGPVSGWFPLRSGKITTALMFRNFVITSSVVARKDAIEKAGLFPEDSELIIAEDLSLWLELSHLGKGYFFKESLVFYDKSGEGVSSDISARFDCLLRVLISKSKKMKINFLLKKVIFLVYWLRRFLKSRHSKADTLHMLESAKSARSNPCLMILLRTLSVFSAYD